MEDPSTPLETNCTFCKLVAGEIPSTRIYEDTNTLAFLNIQPDIPGHALVIPKKHVRNILDVDEETAGAVMKTVGKVACALRDALGAEGVNLIVNNEAVAGQVIFHLHIHIIPRHEGDGLHYGMPHSPAPLEELQKVAEKLRPKLT